MPCFFSATLSKIFLLFSFVTDLKGSISSIYVNNEWLCEWFIQYQFEPIDNH